MSVQPHSAFVLRQGPDWLQITTGYGGEAWAIAVHEECAARFETRQKAEAARSLVQMPRAEIIEVPGRAGDQAEWDRERRIGRFKPSDSLETVCRAVRESAV